MLLLISASEGKATFSPNWRRRGQGFRRHTGLGSILVCISTAMMGRRSAFLVPGGLGM